jgi:predicted acylesterase/phospholipase RssA
MLNDSRQSFGQTALVLQGGSTFGLVHLGVAKCLFQQNLLPRIICGNSVGALIAALVCTRTDDELPVGFFSNLSIHEPKSL